MRRSAHAGVQGFGDGVMGLILSAVQAAAAIAAKASVIFLKVEINRYASFPSTAWIGSMAAPIGVAQLPKLLAWKLGRGMGV